MLHLCVNTEQWNRLPKPYQAVVRQAAEAANSWMLSKYDSVNAPALKRLVGRGTELKGFPADVIEAAYKAAQGYYGEIAEKSPSFKAGLESLNAYLSEQAPWWRIAEHSYDSILINTRMR